jgi:hypothetical protein
VVAIAGLTGKVLAHRDPRDGVLERPALLWQEGLRIHTGFRGLTLIHQGAKPIPVPESLRTNADDRFPQASLGRVEGGDGVVESRDVADVGP